MRAPGRNGLLAGVIALGWCGLLARAFQVQVLQHEDWNQRALARQGDVQPIPAMRGEIRSADGARLAHTVVHRSLVVDPTHVEDKPALAGALAHAGVGDSLAILEQLEANSERRFLWLSRGLVPERALEEVIDRFPVLDPRAEPKRLYPLGRAGGSLVGVIGRDGLPLGGLEHEFSADLSGRDGRMLDISDRTGDHFTGIQRHLLEAPQAGRSVTLTIDSRMQEIAAAHLERVGDEQRAAAGFVIVTRPRTGEILALASYPPLDPSEAATWEGDRLRIRPAMDTFEPGSIFKIVAFAAALESGRVSPDDPIDCMDGRRPMPGGRAIRDDHKCGVVPAREVLAKSSNIGTGLIAERVGAEGFHRMERAFGFGLPSGVDLPGEERGRIPDPSASDSWSDRSLATMAFGQEVACTGIQIAMAYGAIANGGHLMRPWLIREIHEADDRLVEARGPESVRPVLRPEVARTMRELLRGVVDGGTGQKAEIEGFPTAGKTGTAQKYIRELGRYSRERYVASFVGFAPWDDPEVLCVVVLDEPRGDIYGGNVAAPVFQRIVSDVRPLLGGTEPLAASEPRRPATVDSLTVPRVAGLSAAVARRVLQDSGFVPRLEGSGPWVVGAKPEPGALVRLGTVVTLALGGENQAAVMPDLSGLSLRDALLRMRATQGIARVQGAGWVVAQRPAPGTPIESGMSCFVELAPDSSRAWKEFAEVETRASRELAARALAGESASADGDARRRYADHGHPSR